MLDVFALVLGVFILIVALQLRAVLGKPFPSLRARIVNAAAPTGAADLYAEAHPQLVALGFEGPSWVLGASEPPSANMLPLRAVYRNMQLNVLVWLCPPIDIAAPHRLLTYWTTPLEDGRVLISQSFDPYFAAVADERMPAQTIAQKSFADQLQAHQHWCASFTSASPAAIVDDAQILAIGVDAINAQRARLLDRGLLVVDRNGIARPGFRLALRMLSHFWRRPKPGDAARPVPPQRLALLATIVEQARQYAPTRYAQWSLFALSLALFIALGAVFWNVQFAVVLLVAVAFHEFGHFMAMRLFGYRNVHMLALPLVGGVTMGVDADPSAAKRAWMSLMGPLPGIIVGWLLLLWQVLAPPGNEIVADWLWVSIWVFLAVNYLNVLPIPPLDGGHVVQALLPPRWINLQTWFVLIACAIGVVASWAIGLVFLAVVAAIQFIAALKQFAVGRAVKALLPEADALRARPRPLRIARALTALEATEGPTTLALPRINQAIAVLQALETKPMSGLQRLLIGSVFAALLVVPVLGLVVAVGINVLLPGVGLDGMASQMEESLKEQELLEREARTLDLAQLLDEAVAQPPASEAAIVAAEQRIGRPLPKELRTLYRAHNGVEGLGLAPIERIDLAASLQAEALAALAYDGGIQIWPAVTAQDDAADAFDEPEQVTIANANQWIAIGAGGDEEALLFVDTGGKYNQHARLINCDEGCSAYADLSSWLQQHWIARRQSERMQKRMEQARAVARMKFKQTDLPELLAEFEEPSLLVRLIGGAGTWAAPADSDDVQVTEQRLGRTLPDDLRALYALHDGFARLRIAPVAEIEAYVPVAADPDSTNASGAPDTEPKPLWKHASAEGIALDRCIAIGGYPRSDSPAAAWTRAQALLWCPDSGRAEVTVVDLQRDRTFPSVLAYVREAAVEAAAQKSVFTENL